MISLFCIEVYVHRARISTNGKVVAHFSTVLKSVVEQNDISSRMDLTPKIDIASMSPYPSPASPYMQTFISQMLQRAVHIPIFVLRWRVVAFYHNVFVLNVPLKKYIFQDFVNERSYVRCITTQMIHPLVRQWNNVRHIACLKNVPLELQISV